MTTDWTVNLEPIEGCGGAARGYIAVAAPLASIFTDLSPLRLLHPRLVLHRIRTISDCTGAATDPAFSGSSTPSGSSLMPSAGVTTSHPADTMYLAPLSS